MSISPISSSMMSMYVPLISKKDTQIDYEYELIKQQLMTLGITPSGDKSTDKLKLETVQRVQEMMQNQSSMNIKQTSPFEEIMNNLNLSISGDLEKDYEKTIDKLDYEITMAYNDEEKEYFEALKYQVETDYNTAKESRISFAGTNQLASMNKYLLLGIY